MKRILIAALGLFCFTLTATAQKKTSGAIQYEMRIDPVAAASANGMPLSDEMRARMPKEIKSQFELLFNATNASYMPVVEFEDSNSGGGGGMGGPGGGGQGGNRMGNMGGMMRGMGGMGMAGFNTNREYFYSFADKKVYEVFDMNDTTLAVQTKLQLASPMQNMPNQMGGGQGGQRPGQNNQNQNAPQQSAVQFLPGPPTIEHEKTNETKTILGFNCHKVIVKSIRKALILGVENDVVDETTIWYTNDLGFDFSPNTYMWTEGTVLALENKGITVRATSIEYRNVSARDVTIPKKAKVLTQEEYQKRQEAMRARMMNNPNRQGGGNMGNQNRGMMF
ncbi:MAG: hypothetical protein EOO99_09010 [Pedobacter sp.]|nr:MAG: hypothetical protein EOO99_09010 [Pedobacter sp.]